MLGGGGFLGYHAAAEGLAAGHEVTVFSRSGRAPLEGVDGFVEREQGILRAFAATDPARLHRVVRTQLTQGSTGL